jgi:hypothetical protein
MMKFYKNIFLILLSLVAFQGYSQNSLDVLSGAQRQLQLL